MLDPRPVVIRTMDLGGDKMPRFNGIANDMALRAWLARSRLFPGRKSIVPHPDPGDPPGRAKG